VVSVVGDGNVDSETPVVASSILRICRRRDECALVVSVSDVRCNSKKNVQYCSSLHTVLIVIVALYIKYIREQKNKKEMC
jgi:hypothetical protein